MNPKQRRAADRAARQATYNTPAARAMRAFRAGLLPTMDDYLALCNVRNARLASADRARHAREQRKARNANG